MNHRPRIRPVLLSLLLGTLFLSACREERPEALLASARDYLAKNDGRAAAIQAKNALQQNPGSAEARYVLGRALLESGDPAGAEVEARKAADLKYPADRVAPLLARCLLAQGKAEAALAEFSKVEPGDPEDRADLLTVLGLAQAAQGNLAGADAHLSRALEARPDFGPALVGQARVRAANRDYGGALDRVERAIAREESNPEAWKLKGDVLGAKGEWEPALAAYRRALEVRPDFVPARTALISAQLDRMQLKEAGEQLEALKQAAPKDPQTRYLEVLLAFRKGDYKLAQQLVQPLVQMAPENAKIQQLAGAVEYERRAWRQAEGHLSKALAVAPDLPLARRLLVSTYLQAGQPGKALTALQPALDRISGDGQALALAGQVYLQNGDVPRAERYFAQAAALDPEDVAKRTSLALTRIVKGQVDSGQGELERIAARDKGTVADLALISSFLERGQYDRALLAIAGLEKKEPGQPLAHDLRGRTLEALNRRGDARASFEKALSLQASYFPAVAGLVRLDVAEGRPQDARKRLESLVSADGNHLQALLALAELRRRMDAKPEEVAAILNRAALAAPAEAAPRLALVDHYLRQKDAPRALSAAQDAAGALPDRPEVLNILGIAQQAAKDYQQALATYGKLAALEPDSPQPHLRMADVQLAAGQREAALRSLRKALDISPTAPVASRLHAVLRLQGEGEAGRFAAQWLKDHPKDAGFHGYLGDQAVASKDYDAASRHYRAVVEIEPENPLALNNLAWAAGQMKNPQALEWAEKANRLAPDQPALMDTLALVLLERGDNRRAVELLQKAVRIAPGAAEIRLNLARALIRSGDRTAARKELEELGRLGDRFPGRDQVAELLRQI